MSKNSQLHKNHPQIVKRLKRAEGHLRVTIKMIEEGAACIHLAQQLQAVENAVDNAKKTLIHDHIDHCLDRSLKEARSQRRAALNEFRTITKYL